MRPNVTFGHRGSAVGQTDYSTAKAGIVGLTKAAAKELAPHGIRVNDEMVDYARTAKQGGEPIGRFQLVRAMLAGSYAELDAGRAVALEAGRRHDSGTDRTLGPSSAKLVCSEMVARRPLAGDA